MSAHVLLRGVLLCVMAGWVMGVSAQRLIGSGGLMNVPSADMSPAGTFEGGAAVLQSRMTDDRFDYYTGLYYISFTPFSFVEATFRETLRKTRKSAWDQRRGFYQQDRSTTIRLRPLRETREGWWPSVVIGVNDIYSDHGKSEYAAVYGVVTRHFGLKGVATVGVTAGWARPIDGGTTYDGAFGGIEVRPDIWKDMHLLADAEEKNSSRGRIDITLHPKVSIDNHRLDVLCEYAVAVAPAFETSLWRGNRITLQPVLPLIGGNLRRDNPLRYLRVGIADISQELLRGGRTGLTVAAGMFYPGYAGAHAEASWMATGELTLRAKAGLMGEAVAGDGRYSFGKIDKLTVMAGGEWFEPRSRLQVQLSGGRFVYGDWGARMDVTRHLGDYAVGIYGVWSEGEHNAGFHFAIPMDRRYHGRRGRVRLRMPEYFGWEYEMVSYYKFAGENMGRSYGTWADDNRSARYFQAEYIRLNLQRMMDGGESGDVLRNVLPAKDRE